MSESAPFRYIVVEDETDRVEMMQAAPFHDWQVAPARPGFTQYEPASFEFTPGASQTLHYDRGRNVVVNSEDAPVPTLDDKLQIVALYTSKLAVEAAASDLSSIDFTEIGNSIEEQLALLGASPDDDMGGGAALALEAKAFSVESVARAEVDPAEPPDLDAVRAQLRRKILRVWSVRTSARVAQKDLGIPFDAEIESLSVQLKTLVSDYHSLGRG